MKRATFLAVAAAPLAAIVPAGTSAFQAPKVTKMRLAVEITGIHLVDWHYQSSDELKAKTPGWSAAARRPSASPARSR